jgi:hypothetical protein
LTRAANKNGNPPLFQFIEAGIVLMYKVVMPTNKYQKKNEVDPAVFEPAMNWTIEYVEDQQYVRVSLSGKFSPEHHRFMIEDVLARDFWRPGLNVLFDNRNLDFGVTSVEIMRLASQNQIKHNDRIGSGKVALLMKSLSDYARGRQYEILAEGKALTKVRTFRNEKEALRWLSE